MTRRAFIEAVRRYCPVCLKVINPMTEIENDAEKDGDSPVTKFLLFRCLKCNSVVGRMEVK
jgi:hypothetical protein